MIVFSSVFSSFQNPDQITIVLLLKCAYILAHDMSSGRKLFPKCIKILSMELFTGSECEMGRCWRA